MTGLGYDDQFGSLVALPDGVDVPELTTRMWDRRDRLDETLPFVLSMVRASDLPAWFDREIAAEKKRIKPDTKQGRPRDVTVAAVLVGWLTLKMMGRSSLHSEVARFLLHTISDEQRTALGVPLVTADPTSGTTNDRALLDKQAVAARVTRLMNRMCEVLNPSEYVQPLDLKSKPLKEALRRDATTEELARWPSRRSPAGYAASTRATSASTTRPCRWRHASPAGRNAPPGTSTAGTTSGRRPPATGTPRRSRAGRARRCSRSRSRSGPWTSRWSSPATSPPVTASTSRASPSGSAPTRRAPTLPGTASGSSTCSPLRESPPGTRPGTGSTRTRTSTSGTSPLAEAGWQAVTDYRIETLGRQGITKGGAFLVDGGFVCPCTPDPLIDATYDLRRRDGQQIDHAAYQARQVELDAYRLQNKENADSNGTIRRQCPALGPSPTVICELAIGSDKPRPKPQPDGTMGDTRIEVQIMPTRFEDVAATAAEAKAVAEGKGPAEVKRIKAAARIASVGGIPTLCSSGTTSIRRDVLTKFRQPLTYGKSLHTAVYRAGRNSQEGAHGFAKDEAQESLSQPGRRRKRGLAAQSLYAAVSLAVTTLRKIASFLEHAKPDSTGRLCVPRDTTPGNENVALGEAGGYRDTGDDEQWVPCEDDPPEAA